LGEGVPDARKGFFPSHSAAVAKHLSGAHVTIQARSEEDVVPKDIVKKVSDASGARYSVHNEPAQKFQAPKPVVRPLSISRTLVVVLERTENGSTFMRTVIELCSDRSTRIHSI
jgi:hypothetical protein